MTTATAAARVSIVRREMVLAAVLAAFLAGWTASAAGLDTTTAAAGPRRAAAAAIAFRRMGVALRPLDVRRTRVHLDSW